MAIDLAAIGHTDDINHHFGDVHLVDDPVVSEPKSICANPASELLAPNWSRICREPFNDIFDATSSGVGELLDFTEDCGVKKDPIFRP